MGKLFNKMLAIILSGSLLFICVPCAFAQDNDENSISSNIPPVSDAAKDENADSAIGEIDVDVTASDDAAKNEEPIALTLDAARSEVTPLSVPDSAYLYDVILRQQTNSTNVAISFPNVGAMVSSGKVDRVVVEGVMDYQGVITRTVKADKLFAELASMENSLILDFETYGKFSVQATFYKGDTLVKVGDRQTMGIVANSYNIAPVSATLPVTFFSLSLWGDENIRYDSKGDIVPTIMLMERPNSWDWNALPQGVYPLPYLSKEEVAYQPGSFTEASNLFRAHTKAMVDYVGDLYEMNPEATFNLYVVDYYIGLIQSVLYSNGIPQDNYTITVLSDGAFSYQRFGDVYKGSAPSITHQNLIASWNRAKSEAYATGKVSSGYSLWEPNGSLYAAVDSEPNAQWWLARPALLESYDDGNIFGKNVAQADAQVVRVYIDQKLKNLQAQGDATIQEFKSLYNFGDTFFADAEAEGKKVMLLLGTTVGSENGSFNDYARFTMAYYGDEYKYYYKGHPGSPTEFYPSKIAELENLGIKDVDSSIPAELILFFYPDIFLSGYPSSTYASISNPDMAKGMFRITKAEGINNESYAVMDWWMSAVGESTNPEIRALCKNGDANFLVEYSDVQLTELDYTIAIWNATTASISYYKLENGKYVFVRSTEQGSGQIDSGVYTIGSKAASSKALDILAASNNDGANVQIYDANESFAQRFRIIDVGDGYYTIQNAKSGKMLDVDAAGMQPGTNVHQWSANNTDAQKWKFIPTNDGDGSYNIVSKCNGLYLDQQWAQTNNGTNIWVYSPNGSVAQKFYLNKIIPVIEEGTYTVHSALSDDKVLDVVGAAQNNEANVQIYDSNDTSAQWFDVKYDATTGYYSLSNSGSKKILDTQWGGAYSGTNVWQYEANGSLAQNWSLKKAQDGSLVLYSATGGGCCLDVAGAQVANGSNVQIWTPNGSIAQKWKFLKAA
ncbi:MAG: RICIN domain-containing protein [Gordonibacter sp.]|nr:RICIN domain-containing protein [Gordonibacter sp.]